MGMGQYTGNVGFIAGKAMYEVLYIDGLRQGQTRWISTPPVDLSRRNPTPPPEIH